MGSADVTGDSASEPVNAPNPPGRGARSVSGYAPYSSSCGDSSQAGHRSHAVPYNAADARVDDPDVERPPLPSIAHSGGVSATRPMSHVAATKCTVAEHMTVELLPGFRVDSLATGFESSAIVMTGVEGCVPLKSLSQALNLHGRVVGIDRRPGNSVFVRYAHAAQAARAISVLNGKSLFGQKVRLADVAPRQWSTRLTVRDSTVRVDFELPTKIIYAGYDLLEEAEAGIACAARGVRDHVPLARHHKSVPAVGKYTVKYTGLPADVGKTEIYTLGSPTQHMYERPNYLGSPAEVAAQLRTVLAGKGARASFRLQRGPYLHGKATAWVTYSSAAEAKAACASHDQSKPRCTGGTPITVFQVCSILYHVDAALYEKRSRQISMLAAAAHDRGVDTGFKRLNGGRTMQICMEARQLREVNQLRTELERVLRGQVLRHLGKSMWHPFFALPQGRAFVRAVEAQHALASVIVDASRGEIRVSAPQQERSRIFAALRAKIQWLDVQGRETEPPSGDAVGLYFDPEVVALRKRFGDGCVMLDADRRALFISGGEEVYMEAATVVRRAKERRCLIANDPHACPVCLTEAASPITLSCGHRWCRDCMRGFLNSSAGSGLFPVRCLGDGGGCMENVAHQVASTVLTESELDHLVQAAVTAYVNARPDEFRYCPTPDCKQVYRVARREGALQCPACLLRICSACHSQYHGSLPCHADDGVAELEEWMQASDAKRCPACRVPIERSGGCHHMTCTQCGTHICWECMETFPGGDGIYGHMRSEHESFGPGPD
ncbi:hypothetical protein EV121DRAFT_218977 [Schizophyllum commune]